jgi:hypothetical protein
VQFFREIGYECFDEGKPPKLFCLQEDHSAARNSGGRGLGEILHFEHHSHPASQLDNLTTCEAKLLVVIQHCIHVLDPHSVDRAIEHHPFSLLYLRLLSTLSHQNSNHSISPTFCIGIQLTIELIRSNRLGIEFKLCDFDKILVSVE